MQIYLSRSKVQLFDFTMLLVKLNTKKKNLRGFGPLANYADRATAACWRSSANFCG
jgi:hypothetical protein